MSDSVTPSALWERAHELVQEYDLGAFADLFAADGVMEFPFAPPGTPRRLVGPQEIRATLVPAGERARQAGRRILRYSPVVVHETADPEVIVAEFDLHGETADGESYEISYVQVLRAREGRIVSLRDYIDYRALAEAGRVAQAL
jgi:ketosteroid isomerase-like protein